MRKRFILSVAIVAVLAACSSEKPKIKFPKGSISSSLKAVFKRKSKKQVTDPSSGLTRASLKGIPGPLIFAHLDKTDAYASLGLIGDNQGVKTFLTSDNISLSEKKGVVLATRGLGGDLMAADVTGSVAAINRMVSPEYPRVMHWLDGQDQTTSLNFSCSITKIGAETLVVLGTSIPTIHLKETCKSSKTTFENDYWRAPNSPVIWQSRQWLGDASGYIDLQLWVR